MTATMSLRCSKCRNVYPHYFMQEFDIMQCLFCVNKLPIPTEKEVDELKLKYNNKEIEIINNKIINIKQKESAKMPKQSKEQSDKINNFVSEVENLLSNKNLTPKEMKGILNRCYKNVVANEPKVEEAVDAEQ